MGLWSAFWNDESGVILSAETVLLGTVGVLGAVAGLNAVGGSINGELKELACAFRSLDQSYSISGQQCCGAFVAGSCYRQPSAAESIAEMMKSSEGEPAGCEEADDDGDHEEEHHDEGHKEMPTSEDV